MTKTRLLNKDQQLLTKLHEQYHNLKGGIVIELFHMGVGPPISKVDIETVRIALHEAEAPLGMKTLERLEGLSPRIEIVAYTRAWIYFQWVLQVALTEIGFLPTEIVAVFDNDAHRSITYN